MEIISLHFGVKGDRFFILHASMSGFETGFCGCACRGGEQ